MLSVGEEGRSFKLRTEDLGSVEIGSPVTFRSYDVGQVTGYELDPTGDFVTLSVFVKSPHDQRVLTHTRFWNASGLDIILDTEGIRIDSPSFVSMMIGGVAFDTPTGGRVRLAELARVVVERGPNTISREDVQRKIVVQANVAGRDLGSTVDEIRERVRQAVPMPADYHVEYGGQFESQEEATRQIALLSVLAVVDRKSTV